MKLLRKKGVTSQIIEVFIQSTLLGDGGGLTGLLHNSGSLTAYYHRNTAAAAVAVTLVDMTVGTFTSSGFKAVDGTNMPGLYQFCLPDAAYVTGADSVSFMLKGASNMVVVVGEIQLIDIDINDTVRAGLTALPNAAVGAAGGLIGAGTGSNQIDLTSGKVKPADGSIAAATFAAGAIDAAAIADNAIDAGAIAANAITSAKIATDAIGAAQIAADAIGASELAADAVAEIQSGLSTLTAAGVRTAVGLASANLDTQLSTIDDFLDTEVNAIKAVTDAITATGAGLSAIPWNAAWDAEVQSEVTDALVAYDPPTEAEMNARTLLAASYATAAGVSALNNLSAAQVNAEVLDVLAVDTFVEPAAVPAATASLKDKIGWLMAIARNKITQTSTTQTLRNDADNASIATAAVSDDGTTGIRGEWS